MRNYVRRGRQKEEIRYPRQGKWQIGICCGIFVLLFGLKLLPNEKIQTFLCRVRAVSTAEVIPKEEDIGKLSYVSKMLPEAVQSVWNENTGGVMLSVPFADGVLLSDGTNGAVFEGHGDVLAGSAGKVQGVGEVAEGFALTVLYGDNLTATYAPLCGVKAAAGENVEAGQSIGIAFDVGEAKQVRMHVSRNGNTEEAKAWLK